MPSEILMPALSPTMEEGKLVKWLVREGDRVRAGDVIAEIETDKATMEVEAAEDGKLGTILVAEGSEHVPVNQPIALLLTDGEDVAEASSVETRPAAAPQDEARASRTAAALQREEGASAPVSKGEGTQAISPSPQPSPQRGEGAARETRRAHTRRRD